MCGRRNCYRCGRWRPITDFAHKADGRASKGLYVEGQCWPCKRAYGRQWYAKHSAIHIANVAQWRDNNPELMKGYRKVETARRRDTEEKRLRDNARRQSYYQANLKRSRRYHRERARERRGSDPSTNRIKDTEVMEYLDAYPSGEALRDHGLDIKSYRQFAERSGVSRKTVLKALTTTRPGVEKMRITSVDKIAVALGEPLEFLYMDAA